MLHGFVLWKQNGLLSYLEKYQLLIDSCYFFSSSSFMGYLVKRILTIPPNIYDGFFGRKQLKDPKLASALLLNIRLIKSIILDLTSGLWIKQCCDLQKSLINICNIHERMLLRYIFECFRYFFCGLLQKILKTKHLPKNLLISHNDKTFAYLLVRNSLILFMT